MVMTKIVDYIPAAGVLQVIDNLLQPFDKQLILRTTDHSLEKIRYFGFTTWRNDDFSIESDGDDNLSALQPAPLTRSHRKEVSTILNKIENACFTSIISSFRWLRIMVSLVCC